MDLSEARALIADHLAISPELVRDEAEFRALGADSLDLVTLTMCFEEAFDLVIPDDQVDRCVTVGDALEVLEGACRQIA